MSTRILMSGDEPDVRELFRQNFRREIRAGDYAFDFALSGEAALDLLRSRSPPEAVLVLSDINMPGMTGLELLAAIRREWPAVAVFMITAFGDQGTEAKARKLGAEGFLAKPLDFGRLKQDLSQVLERSP